MASKQGGGGRATRGSDKIRKSGVYKELEEEFKKLRLELNVSVGNKQALMDEVQVELVAAESLVAILRIAQKQQEWTMVKRCAEGR